MMAVAMEVGWRGPELGSPSFSHLKHKAPPANTSTSSSSWGGADPQKVLQLMMGQVHEERPPTLDLLGNKSSSSPAVGAAETLPDEFVELEPDLHAPSGWEKCLDLKSGKVYYVNRHTGAETCSDPMKQGPMMPDAQAPSALPQTRDFLGSKESEKEKLGELSGRSPPPSFSGREMEREKEGSETSMFRSGPREQWGCGWLGSGSGSFSEKLLKEVGSADNGLELKLNLQGKTLVPSSVCTLERVEMALMTEKMLPVGKRVASAGLISPSPADQLLRSNHNHSASHVSPSPSTSSSSTSTSSRPSLLGYQVLDKENQNSNKRQAAAASPLVETEGDSAEEISMLGGCKSCLMFVMLSKSNPICPRCGTSAALDFSHFPSKRTKFETDRRD